MPSVVIARGANHDIDALRPHDIRLIQPDSDLELIDTIKANQDVILVLGTDLSPDQSIRILSLLRTTLPERRFPTLVLNASANFSIFQDFIDEDRLLYLCRTGLAGNQLASLLMSAVYRIPHPLDLPVPESILELCSHLWSQQNLSEAVGVLIQAAEDCIGAEEVQCMIYDSSDQILWSTDHVSGKKKIDSAASGIIGYVAQTGDFVKLERAGSDCRYDSTLDTSDPSARLLAAAIPGQGRRIMAVISATRNGAAAPFTPEEVDAFRLMAECAGAPISDLVFQEKVNYLLSERSSNIRGDSTIYREEALAWYRRRENGVSCILQGAPRWLNVAFVISVITAALCLAATGAYKTPEYACGIASVQQPHVIALVSEGLSHKFHSGMLMILESPARHTPPLTILISRVETPQADISGTGDLRTMDDSSRGPLVTLVLHPAVPLPNYKGWTGTVCIAVGSKPVLRDAIPVLNRILGR